MLMHTNNLTLFDKLRISMPEASGHERVSVDKLAAASCVSFGGNSFHAGKGMEILQQ